MPFGPELRPTPANTLPGHGLDQIPPILIGLIASIRCLESAYDLLRITDPRGDTEIHARQVRMTLEGLHQMRDGLATKLEAHPLFDAHFVRVNPLPEAGAARLRALGVN